MTAKRIVNITVDSELAESVEALGDEAPAVVETALRMALSRRRNSIADAEIELAIASHNRFIDRHGVWSEAYREW